MTTGHFTAEGDGSPVVLLHGGMSDGTGWVLQVPALVAAGHRVLVPDRRGHGKTPDTDAPFAYDDMADETVRFLDDEVASPAALVGWSDGGIVALLVSLRRPDLVRRQVLIGANYHHEGLLDAFDPGDDPDADDVGLLRAIYQANAVDPEHWPVFFAKTAALWRTQPTLTVDDVAEVSVPTLVLAGDDEVVALAHTVSLYEAIDPALGQLAIVPGTSHALLLEKPDLVNRLLVDFLAEQQPPTTFLPVRRA